ncbi:MAG TPA: glycosyltransferase family 39 protein [Candidatus Paceibacterota bacterium]
MPRFYRLFILIFILGVAVFFRFFNLETIPPGLFPDEAMNGNNAYEALHTGNFKVFYRENNGREGLFINMQALSMAVFGNTAYALRFVSALFGVLTVLALYFFARGYTGNERLAFIASFLVATSFWHVNFSRIGFRAITAPFYLTAGLAFLYYAWNRRDDATHTKAILSSVAGGILFGLGFHSYIAYRIAPLILIPPLLLFLKNAREDRSRCVLCFLALFLFFALIATVPIVLYFAQNPQDFLGRTSQISIFASGHPFTQFASNTAKTIGMFFFAGDFNPRHNLAGSPELWWPVSILFIIGIFESLRRRYALPFFWFLIMMLPVALSSEGVPHALRAIILIPPTFFFAAVGLEYIWAGATSWLQKSETEFPDIANLIRRIEKEFFILIFALLGAIAVYTFNSYFQIWAVKDTTARAFEEHLYRYGVFLDKLPDDVPKYIVTDDGDRIDRTGTPMAIQPILFATRTYMPKPEGARNIHYLNIKDVNTIKCEKECFIIPIGHVPSIMDTVRAQIPSITLTEQNKLLIGIKTQKQK